MHETNLLTDNEREIIPQIVTMVTKLSPSQQSWVLGWMYAKAEENEDGNFRRRKKRKDNSQ